MFDLVGAFSVIVKTDCETDGSFYSTNRDPHNCYGSCAEPGPGCLACSNTSYLRCSRAGVPICLHPRLRCNHQADCDNAEDERLEECYTAYLSQGHINQYATLRCQDKVHPKMQGSPYHTFLIMP